MSDFDGLEELKQILGDDVFDELETRGHSQISDFTEMLQSGIVDDKLLKKVSETEYEVPLVFNGPTVLDTVAALFHAAENQCQDCERMLMEFAVRVIAKIWVATLKAEGVLGDYDLGDFFDE